MKKTSGQIKNRLRRTLASGVMATCIVMLVVSGNIGRVQGDVSAIDLTVLHSLDAHYTHSMFVYGHSCVPPPNSGMVAMFC